MSSAHIIHVATNGSDTATGTAQDPLATLEGARDAIRALPPGERHDGITVLVHGGVYPRRESFVLTEADSGTPEAPVRYEAAPGEEVRLSGGCTIETFTPVTDPAILERLVPEARVHVLQADLRAHGVEDFGRLTSRGFGRPSTPAHLELFVNGQPMTLARWPNDDFVTISGIPEAGAHDDGHHTIIGDLERGFYYTGNRPRRWAALDNVWMHGYWAYDWANTYEAVDQIDLDSGLITTKPPHGLYGFRADNRFYFLNVLEELDVPGEYYVDADRGMLYFWPPHFPQGQAGATADQPVARDTSAMVSVLPEPLIVLQDVSNVTIDGLTLACSRGIGVVITGGTDNTISDCTMHALGQHAVTVEGGLRHTVRGCDIANVGDSGIRLTGGDPTTLARGEHSAHNNHIHHYSHWSRCYQPAIGLWGVGLHATHNLIHHAPHTGILYGGNDHEIAANEIHHVTLETGDCGAIYSGRSWTQRGTIIRHNFIHHTGGVGMGSMGVYLDDQLSGQTIVGNIFWQVTRAAFVGGGRDNRVENNIFVDCEPAVYVDGRGLVGGGVWGEQVKKLKREVTGLPPEQAVLYRERYPALASLDPFLADMTCEFVPPEDNVIARNVCVGGRWLDIVWEAEERHLIIGRNLTDEDPQFVDPEHGDFSLQPTSPAWALGFDPIPVDTIGLL